MLLGSAGNQGAYEIERSLRFNSGDSTYLNFTPGSAGNQKTWTWSAWIKRSGDLGSYQHLFNPVNGADGVNEATIRFDNLDRFQVYDSGTLRGNLITSQVFRDVSAWYHIVVALDTTQATASNRLKIYVNGQQVTAFDTETYPTQDTTWGWNGAQRHDLGRYAYAGSLYFNGYMAEVNFIDGTALDETDFGETDEDTGAWIPKEYTGSHGTNGWYLNFSDDSSVSALGSDSSNNSNNWTPNNFSVLVNPSYPYALSATGGIYDRDLAFDGSTSTFAGTNTSTTITFAPSGGIAYSTSVEFYTSNGGGPGSNDQRYSFNGGAEVNCSGGEYTTVASGSGTLTSLAVRTTLVAPCRLNAIRIDGSIVLAEFRKGSDSMVDSPTTNYATLNSEDSYGGNLFQGNLEYAGTYSSGGSQNGHAARSTLKVPSSGKWYYEAENITYAGSGNACMLGFTASEQSISATAFSGTLTPWIGVNASVFSSNIRLQWVGVSGGTPINTTLFSSYDEGDIVNFAIDFDDGKFWVGKNGTWYNSGDPAAGTNATSTFTAGTAPWAGLAEYVASSNNANRSKPRVNFGQQGFDFDVPDGFLAMNTANLSVPTVKDGTEYFNTVLYAGTGVSNPRTDVGFQPDWVWIKKRNGAENHEIQDSVRGATKRLNLPGTAAETTVAGSISSFDATGFTVVDAGTTNESGFNYVAWSWKESVDAGFDIVTDTGTGAAKTVPHNLGVAPKMIIRKSRTSSTGHWYVYHYEEGASEAGILQLNNAFASSTAWNSTAPTSSVFSVGSNVDENKLNDNFISYLFAEVDGFSKFGSYVGTGNTNGPFINCGFSVAYLMVKKASATEDWAIYDNKRNPINPKDEELFADTNAAKYDGNRYIDFYSNGFKPKANSGTGNLSGQTYVFMAFAKNPFKYANAV